MIGGHADVCGAVFDHLQDTVQHTDDRPEGFILAFIKGPLSVKMPEEFVGTVDEVYDHTGKMRISTQLASCCGIIVNYRPVLHPGEDRHLNRPAPGYKHGNHAKNDVCADRRKLTPEQMKDQRE